MQQQGQKTKRNGAKTIASIQDYLIGKTEKIAEETPARWRRRAQTAMTAEWGRRAKLMQKFHERVLEKQKKKGRNKRGKKN